MVKNQYSFMASKIIKSVFLSNVIKILIRFLNNNVIKDIKTFLYNNVIKISIIFSPCWQERDLLLTIDELIGVALLPFNFQNTFFSKTL